MTKPNSLVIELLYQSILTPHGLIIETDDVAFLQQKFYAARRSLPHIEEFKQLSFIPSPTNPQQLWIVKTGKTNASE